MQSHNMFNENAKANETLAFIKSDPRFTTDRSRASTCAANKSTIILMPSLNDAYMIDVFQRIIHMGSNPMTGNVDYAREDKEYQLKVNLNGEVDVFAADGQKTNKSLDEFIFTEKARILIATLKRDGFYQSINDGHCDTVDFSRAATQNYGYRSISTIDMKIYPSGKFFYVATFDDHSKDKPHRSYTHDLDGFNDALAKAYHQNVIMPLTNNARHDSPRLK
jgi:hypothetical protein